MRTDREAAATATFDATPAAQPLRPRPAPPIALAPPPSPGARALHLHREALAAADEHLAAFAAAIAGVGELAEAVSESPDLYGPGLADLARQISEDLHWRGQTLALLAGRRRAPAPSGRRATG